MRFMISWLIDVFFYESNLWAHILSYYLFFKYTFALMAEISLLWDIYLKKRETERDNVLLSELKYPSVQVKGASLVVQKVKRLSTMRKTRVRSLGREDPLEKELATHSSVLAWRIPWMEEPGGPQSMGSQRVGHDWMTNTHAQIP